MWESIETSDAKLSKLYQIRGRADVYYSGRAQRAPIQEKKEYSHPMLFDIHFYVMFPYKHTDY